MSTAVKLSDSIVSQARAVSKVLNRSLTGQIEYWAKVGKLAEENPNLNYSLIKDILIAKQEVKREELDSYNFSADNE